MSSGLFARVISVGAAGSLLALFLFAGGCADDKASNQTEEAEQTTSRTEGSDQGTLREDTRVTDGDRQDNTQVTDGDDDATLELEGHWASSWGQEMTIDSFVWGDSKVVSYDNEANHAVLESAGIDGGDATYAQVVWTEPNDDGTFYECWVSHGQQSAELAMDNAESFDDTEPAASGCGAGDFSWTHWQPALELGGVWASNWGQTAAIDSFVWGDSMVVSYDNESNSALLESAGVDGGDAIYAQVVWTEPGDDGTFYECWVSHGQQSAELAMDNAESFDDTEPAASGCGAGDFSWTAWQPAPNLYDTLTQQGEFSLFLDVVDAAGLAEMLEGQGTFTVFAPTDEAFETLPDGVLDDLLAPENSQALVELFLHHIVENSRLLMADILATGGSLLMASGKEALVDAEALSIGSATIADTVQNLLTANGVIHGLEAVMVVPEL
jgi:uncharacterized surface protein with fasciclin (FAS1) repeats